MRYIKEIEKILKKKPIICEICVLFNSFSEEHRTEFINKFLKGETE